MPVKKNSSSEVPRWCWWCCHDFPNNTPLSLPVAYDSKTDLFTTFGCFCSFECMKAYNHYENNSQKNNQYMLISFMYSKANPHAPFTRVGCAPPRQCLIEFGGDMSIDQFRETSREFVYDLRLPPIVKIDHVIEKQQSNWVMRTESAKSVNDTTFKSDTKVMNNAIKIKPNPKKMTTLDAVFGISTA
jgi:hypothetical protein